ncbi:hypothetical protein ACFSCX_05925 [Bacillus salitolerans]|uniref:Uncharacterized protein n=1 Tax=Bacillus salitolerans TaxID=1437434 RepID=A0ABW4LLS3_9BACI
MKNFFKKTCLIFFMIGVLKVTPINDKDVHAAGTQYYYNKYTVQSYEIYSESSWMNGGGFDGMEGDPNYTTSDKYSSYTFASVQGRYIETGTLVGGDYANMQWYPIGSYYVDNNFSKNTLYKITGNSGGWIYVDKKVVSVSTGERRGTLVQSNVVGVDGTYPNNGKHSDGYWYVKGSIVNNTPTINLTTSNNQILSEVNGKNVLQLNGNVLDTDIGDTINVKFSIDGTTGYQSKVLP